MHRTTPSLRAIARLLLELDDHARHSPIVWGPRRPADQRARQTARTAALGGDDLGDVKASRSQIVPAARAAGARGPSAQRLACAVARSSGCSLTRISRSAARSVAARAAGLARCGGARRAIRRGVGARSTSGDRDACQDPHARRPPSVDFRHPTKIRPSWSNAKMRGFRLGLGRYLATEGSMVKNNTPGELRLKVLLKVVPQTA